MDISSPTAPVLDTPVGVTAANGSRLSDSELVKRAEALAERVRERAGDAAKARKPDDAIIRELVDSGLANMLVPARFGGSEASFETMYDVVKPISAACPSTGWIAAFYILHNIYITKFPKETQEEVFAQSGCALLPSATAPNMEARKVDGGWRVSGRAMWGSGIMHADWVMIAGKAGEEQRQFLMPVSDVEVLDTWHYAGMAGTGSNDYVAKDVFVPDRRSIPISDFFEGTAEGAKIHSNPMYRMPFFVAAYCSILPVITGALEGAYQAYLKTVERRVRNHTGAVVKDQQHAHVTLGGFRIATDVNDGLARRVYDKVASILPVRGYTIEDRLEIKGLTAYISNQARATVSEMMTVCGSSNFHVESVLQRHWRDLNTVCSHAFWDWDVTRELVGRDELGLELNSPMV